MIIALMIILGVGIASPFVYLFVQLVYDMSHI